MMSELRLAAETLRERAAAATSGPWVAEQNWIDLGVPDNTQTIRGADGLAIGDAYLHSSRERNSEYITTMHPSVGFALADWLHKTAVAVEHGGSHAPFAREATVVARLINGGAR